MTLQARHPLHQFIGVKALKEYGEAEGFHFFRPFEDGITGLGYAAACIAIYGVHSRYCTM